MSSQLPDTFHAQTRPEVRFKLIKSAISQHNQLGWAMTIIEGFPEVPPELRARQGASKNAVVQNWRLWRREDGKHRDRK